MFNTQLGFNKALPTEYRLAAENLFPAEGFSKKAQTEKCACAFADVLGVGEDYSRFFDAQAALNGDFLARFQNNLALLIQKTWVEKSEEARKEKLANRIPQLVDFIEKENYARALEDFGGVMQELAYLFFGAQSQKDDFTEYALRIDPQMGLFWWYGKQLSCAPAVSASSAENSNGEMHKALLLLGICYLANF